MDSPPSLHCLILRVFLKRSRGEATNANIFQAEELPLDGAMLIFGPQKNEAAAASRQPLPKSQP
jgi:hypothetical protein